MSGFEDDFGEMVEPKDVHGDLGDLMAPVIIKTMDPAADFLAREQEQLGELEVEIGTLAGMFSLSQEIFSKMLIPFISVSPQKSPIPFIEKKIKEV